MYPLLWTEGEEEGGEVSGHQTIKVGEIPWRRDHDGMGSLILTVNPGRILLMSD